MKNIFLNKTMSSMLGIPSDKLDMIMKMAEKFSDERIDRNTASSVLNKLMNKTPEEINNVLKRVNEIV